MDTHAAAIDVGDKTGIDFPTTKHSDSIRCGIGEKSVHLTTADCARVIAAGPKAKGINCTAGISYIDTADRASILFRTLLPSFFFSFGFLFFRKTIVKLLLCLLQFRKSHRAAIYEIARREIPALITDSAEIYIRIRKRINEKSAVAASQHSFSTRSQLIAINVQTTRTRTYTRVYAALTRAHDGGTYICIHM